VPGLVIVGGGVGLIVNKTVMVPVPFALVPVRTTLSLTICVVGVPEIKPVNGLTLKPPGRLLAPHVVMGWFACIWYENGIPTNPVAFPLLLRFGGAASAVVPNDIVRAAETTAA
jgi:hypothetical protein